MIKVLFTSDYEIHGNGEGLPFKLMYENTERMLMQFNKYDAKLTLMADVAEILQFKKYFQKTGNDNFHFNDICNQICCIAKTGHDVQLHIHPSYYNAVYVNNSWKLDWKEYNLADLGYDRQYELIKEGKNFLETLIQQDNPAYKCFVFRSANWSMIPSKNIIKALIKNNIYFDTSVFKWGRRNGLVNFDYSSAFNETLPWPVDEQDIRKYSKEGKLFEFPIYTEEARVWSFVSLNRFYRVIQSALHSFNNAKKLLEKNQNYKPIENVIPKQPTFRRVTQTLHKKYALKADFNQCTGRQLINQLLRVEKTYCHLDFDIPFVLIGHSKLFNKLNEISLKPFLKFIKNNPEKYSFATFKDFDNEAYLNNLKKIKNEFD